MTKIITLIIKQDKLFMTKEISDVSFITFGSKFLIINKLNGDREFYKNSTVIEINEKTIHKDK